MVDTCTQPPKVGRACSAWAAALFGLVAGCDGVVVEPAATPPAAARGDGPELEPDDGFPEPSDSCDRPRAGPAPLRRLTREEYAHAVEQLLGDGGDVVERFFPDERVGPFRSNLAPVSDLHVEQLAAAAEELAARAVQDVDRLVGCNPQERGERECGIRFIANLGRRAYRRPLSDMERERYVALFDGVLASDGYVSAVRRVLQGMLQSVHFLYHVPETQPSGGGGPARLTPYALATRLSFALTRRPPDDELLDAAAAGALHDPEEVERHARRLLETAPGRQTFAHFHLQLLGIEEAMSEGVLTDEFLATETRDFIDHVMEDDGSLTSLLTAPFTVGDARTAEIYDVPAPEGDRDVLDLDPERRAGLLTHPSFLTTHDGTVTRGLAVNELLLCSTIPPPPPGVDADLPEAEPGASPRERWRVHVADPSCAGCHERIDPIGFGFDHYDDRGRWRDTVEGFPVDATGHIAALDGNPAFEGAVEMASMLAASEQVHRCFVRQWMQYALGRPLVAADSCTEEALYARFRETGLDVRDLLVALVRSEAFMSAGEVTGE